MNRLDRTPISVYRYKYTTINGAEWTIYVAARSFEEAEKYIYSRVGEYHIMERGISATIDSMTPGATQQIVNNYNISMEKGDKVNEQV